jgi:hypothetical protein
LFTAAVGAAALGGPNQWRTAEQEWDAEGGVPYADKKLRMGDMMENEESLLSVLSGQNLENLLAPQEAIKIQSKLWDILAQRTESYTMGGSSSVRAETAQELLKSAGFVISHGIQHVLGRGNDNGMRPELFRECLLNDDYDTLFRAGLKAIEALVDEGKALLEAVKRTAIAVQNTAYRGTLKELGVFFSRYHYHHFAHDIPCMLDYPLAHPVDETLLGIDYINDYLRRLLIENDFCGCFEAGTVTALLKSIVPDEKEDLLNIYEALAANAFALTLLGGDIVALDLTAYDRDRLAEQIGAWTEDIAPAKLRAVSAGLCVILDLEGGTAAEYLEQTAIALYARLKPSLRHKRLETVFPSLYRENPEKKNAAMYIDNPPMDNGKLRTLIDALSSCRTVSEKIALARRHVGSLRDWAEVLGVCFWGDELTALFMSFSSAEIDLLRRYVCEKQRKYPQWASETGWESILTDFVGED